MTCANLDRGVLVRPGGWAKSDVVGERTLVDHHDVAERHVKLVGIHAGIQPYA